MSSTNYATIDSTFPAQRRSNRETPVLQFSAWTHLKYRLPRSLRPICNRIERYVFAHRGVPVWVDSTLVRMRVDACPVPVDSAGHQEEQELMRRVLRSLKPDDLFLDVGSHIGLYALAVAVRVGRTGRVIAFEPSPMTAEKLRRNIRLNDAGRPIRVEEIALSDTGGSVVMVTTAAAR